MKLVGAEDGFGAQNREHGVGGSGPVAVHPGVQAVKEEIGEQRADKRDKQHDRIVPSGR